jgi:hypothetical protein
MKLTTHLELVPRSIKCGCIHAEEKLYPFYRCMNMNQMNLTFWLIVFRNMEIQEPG